MCFCEWTTKNKRNNACILKVKSCLLFLFILSSFLNASPYSRNIYFLYLLGITFYKCVENMVFLLFILFFCYCFFNQGIRTEFFLKDFHSSDLQHSCISLGLSISFYLSFLMKFIQEKKLLLLPNFILVGDGYEYLSTIWRIK